LADTIKATTINSGVYLPVENSYLLGTDQGLLKGQYQPEINDYVFGQLPHLASGKIDVSFMYKQSDSLIWISTKAQGNYVFNPHTDALKKLAFNDALGDVEFRDMAVEQNGQIWISVKGQGVFQLDQNLRILKNLNTTNGFIHNEIYAICPDNEGNIWFGSREAGLVMLDKAGQLIYFTQQGLFPSKSVNDIIKDAQGNIWIATNGEGLFTFRKGEFYNLKKKDGLLSDFCDNLTLIPEHQSLWVKHRNGLSQIDPDDRILTYSTNMNFSDNSLDKSVFFNGDNNSLWLNEKSKLIRVATLSLQRTTPKQKPKITGVSFSFANENEINFSERGKRPVFTPENLELSHEADHLTFRFVAIAYQPFHKNYYRYKLLGFEQNWSPVTENNTATYTNLKPGNYTLQVMSTNNPKNWIKSTTEYNFHIIKPYWEEWWFYMGQIIVFIMLFLITYNMSRYSKNRKRDKWILRLMVYVCLFIMFEYLQTFLEPYTTIFTNGVPVFKLMINLILALVLFPVEAFITTYFYSKSTTVNHIK
ncbi:MAG: hypothetical protein OEX02_02865, partial [Cyclobacteriaceae bacterium]|nr:hypothetical protein [Cyclobacteriaceae bacterium]